MRTDDRPMGSGRCWIRRTAPVWTGMVLAAAGWGLAVAFGVGVPKKLAPERIFAVPGVEVSVYFDNLGFVGDPDTLFPSVKFSGGFGRLERRRWVGTPAEADIGEHTLWVELAEYDEKNPDWYDEGGRRTYEIRIVVEPLEREERKLRVLIVGDSITRQMYWPNYLVRHLKEKSGVEVSMIGQVEWAEGSGAGMGRVAIGSGEGRLLDYEEGFETDLSNYRAASDPGVRAEAYNGWTTGSYLQEQFKYAPTANPESDVSRSPFWWPEAMVDAKKNVADLLSYGSTSDGSPTDPGELSFKKYLEIHAGGVPPDVVIIMLGTNDSYFVGQVLGIKNIRWSASNFIGRVEKMIALFREVNPELPVIVVSPPPVAVSKSAYQQNFGAASAAEAAMAKLSVQTHHETMVGRLSGREGEGIYYVPAHVGMDPVDGYLPTQLVHPSPWGHRQLADQVYAYLVHWMRSGKEL